MFSAVTANIKATILTWHTCSYLQPFYDTRFTMRRYLQIFHHVGSRTLDLVFAEHNHISPANFHSLLPFSSYMSASGALGFVFSEWLWKQCSRTMTYQNRKRRERATAAQHTYIVLVANHSSFVYQFLALFRSCCSSSLARVFPWLVRNETKLYLLLLCRVLEPCDEILQVKTTSVSKLLYSYFVNWYSYTYIVPLYCHDSAFT